MKLILLLVGIVTAAFVIFSAVWLYTPDKPLAELEARYLRAPGDYLEVAGIRLHLRDSGPKDAPVIVLLHGFGSSLHTWEAWATALARDHRVIRFDLPGSGLTGPDPTGNYTDARGLEILTALMDRLAIPRVTLIGNSIGGRIAWTFAALNAARVDKLVLISPDGFAGPGAEYGRPSSVPASVRLLRYILPKPMVRMSLAPAYGDPAKLTDALVERYRDLMLAPGTRGAMIARMEQTILSDPEPLLTRVRAPTLILWGEKDAMIPVSNASDYGRLIAGSTLMSFPGLGHVPQEEAPEVTLAPVQSFLRT